MHGVFPRYGHIMHNATQCDLSRHTFKTQIAGIIDNLGVIRKTVNGAPFNLDMYVVMQYITHSTVPHTLDIFGPGGCYLQLYNRYKVIPRANMIL